MVWLGPWRAHFMTSWDAISCISGNMLRMASGPSWGSNTRCAIPQFSSCGPLAVNNPSCTPFRTCSSAAAMIFEKRSSLQISSINACEPTTIRSLPARLNFHIGPTCVSLGYFYNRLKRRTVCVCEVAEGLDWILSVNVGDVSNKRKSWGTRDCHCVWTHVLDFLEQKVDMKKKRRKRRKSVAHCYLKGCC